MHIYDLYQRGWMIETQSFASRGLPFSTEIFNITHLWNEIHVYIAASKFLMSFQVLVIMFFTLMQRHPSKAISQNVVI